MKHGSLEYVPRIQLEKWLGHDLWAEINGESSRIRHPSQLPRRKKVEERKRASNVARQHQRAVSPLEASAPRTENWEERRNNLMPANIHLTLHMCWRGQKKKARRNPLLMNLAWTEIFIQINQNKSILVTMARNYLRPSPRPPKARITCVAFL